MMAQCLLLILFIVSTLLSGCHSSKRTSRFGTSPGIEESSSVPALGEDSDFDRAVQQAIADSKKDTSNEVSANLLDADGQTLYQIQKWRIEDRSVKLDNKAEDDTVAVTNCFTFDDSDSQPCPILFVFQSPQNTSQEGKGMIFHRQSSAKDNRVVEFVRLVEIDVKSLEDLQARYNAEALRKLVHPASAKSRDSI